MISVNPLVKKKIPWGSFGGDVAFPNFEEYYDMSMYRFYRVAPYDVRYLCCTSVLTSPFDVWNQLTNTMEVNGRRFKELTDKLILFHQAFIKSFSGHISTVLINDTSVFSTLREEQIRNLYFPELTTFIKETYAVSTNIVFAVNEENDIEYLDDICNLPIEEIRVLHKSGIYQRFDGGEGVILRPNGKEIKIRGEWV